MADCAPLLTEMFQVRILGEEQLLTTTQLLRYNIHTETGALELRRKDGKEKER